MLKLFPGRSCRIKWCRYFFGLWQEKKVRCIVELGVWSRWIPPTLLESVFDYICE